MKNKRLYGKTVIITGASGGIGFNVAKILIEQYDCKVLGIARNEEKLLSSMTDEQKEIFSRYQDCAREFQALAECLLFQNSFKLGARMMLEVMEDN